ncbi:MAG: hypothetical protein LOD87_02250 [Planifilum fulgidum]
MNRTIPPAVVPEEGPGPAEAVAMVSGGEPALAWDLAKLSGRKLYYSSDKAVRELGYSPTPFEKTVEKTVRWLKERWKSAGRG